MESCHDVLEYVSCAPMGVLRTFLALCVLQQHYPFWRNNIWLHGFVAVCCFFLISGFYMSLVLDQKYRDNTNLFYLNRFLRLMPVWWVILALTIVGNEAELLTHLPCCNNPTGVMQPSRDYSVLDRLRGITENVFLFPVALEAMITGRFEVPMTAGQMFTVGLELLFYIVAPFIARVKGWPFYFVILVAGALHFWPHYVGLPSRPWQYEFFPSVLLFFLIGMASYRIYSHAYSLPLLASWSDKRFGWLILPMLLVYGYGFHDVLGTDMSNNWKVLGLYLIVAAAMPLLFAASKSSQVDRFINDLSYPIYTSHFMIMAWVENLQISVEATRHWLVFGVVMIISILLVILVEWPLQSVRNRLLELYAASGPSSEGKDQSGRLYKQV